MPAPSRPNTVYLIDGTAYIHRAYHAIRSLATSKGLPTNAAFGFARMLIKLMADKSPQYAAMFFDSRGPTFRHDIYPEYKANRPPMPDDMAVQIPYIRRLTEGFNLPVFELPGYEADDLIGTVARKAVDEGFEVVMVTGDKDFMQLVTDRVTIWDPMKDEALDQATVTAKHGLEPRQILDLLGLAGDTADNIPGVPGIGPKTAVALLQAHGTLEGIYDHLDAIASKSQREKLINNREQAFLSRRLAAIETQAPIDVDVSCLIVRGPDNRKLSHIFQELEFRQLQKEFPVTGDLSQKTYQAILDQKGLDALVHALEQAQSFALDTETTGTDPMTAGLVGLSFAVRPHEAFYVPVGHTYPGAPVQLALDEVLSRLSPVLGDPAIAKIGQNIKYDWAVLRRHGSELAGVRFDTMIASYLINPEKRAHNLDQIALDFLGHHTITFDQVTTGENGKKCNFSEVPIERAVPYACEDADITFMASEVFAPLLADRGLTRLFETVEMPLVPVLLKMETTGIRVDKDRLRETAKNLSHQLAVIEGEIYALAGEEFNIQSPQQMGVVLFEKLKLPVQKKTRKKTAYSTDVDVLTALADLHKLPALALRHRMLAKLKSTYVDALFDLVNPQTGRIHTSFNQTVTATGRLSSSNPNLQNIPIRTEEGREVRRAFIPKEGWRFVSLDYSQIELRLLAHYSGDPILIDAFLNDEDIHARTAAEVFEVLPGMVSSDLRQQAKTINFGIMYGMSAFSLSKELHISQKMAKTYIDHYFSRYSGVKRFIDETIETSRQTGKTTTALGRIRHLPDINSQNATLRGFAERNAVNTKIQGTAADLIKLAMIRVDEALTRRGLRAALLLSVHDELVFEAPPEEVQAVKALASNIMETVWELKAPLKVNAAVGENWAQAH